MTRRALVVCSIIAFLFTGSVFAQTLGAVMTGSQETPGPCATQGFGNATVTFDATHQNVTATITVANLGSPITGFHIHQGVLGVAGNIVENFQGLGGQFVNGTMSGTFPITSDVAQ